MGWFVFAAVGKINLTVEIAGTVTRNVYKGIGLYNTRNMYTLYMYLSFREYGIFGEGSQISTKRAFSLLIG